METETFDTAPSNQNGTDMFLQKVESALHHAGTDALSLRMHGDYVTVPPLNLVHLFHTSKPSDRGKLEASVDRFIYFHKPSTPLQKCCHFVQNTQ